MHKINKIKMNNEQETSSFVFAYLIKTMRRHKA